MQLIKQLFLVLTISLLPMLAGQAAWAATSPTELVKQTADDVLNIVRTDPDIQAGNNEKLYALAEEKILPYFDFNRVCRLVLGKHWRRASDAQKASFQTEFRTLLLRTYSSALVKYKIKTIEFKKEKYSKDKSMVKVPATIIQESGPAISVAYTLKQKAGEWKVFDIVIESISLVTNYRSQFANEIRQNGLDSLISKLEAKNNQAKGQ